MRYNLSAGDLAKPIFEEQIRETDVNPNCGREPDFG